MWNGSMFAPSKAAPAARWVATMPCRSFGQKKAAELGYAHVGLGLDGYTSQIC